MLPRQVLLFLGSCALVAIASLPFLEWGGGYGYVTLIVPPPAAIFWLALPVLAVPLAVAAAWRGRRDDWIAGYGGSLAGSLPWGAAHLLELGDPSSTLGVLLVTSIVILVPYLVVGGIRLALSAAAGAVHRRRTSSPGTGDTEPRDPATR